MIKTGGHTIGARCLGRVHLVKGFQDFFPSEGFGKLSIHLLSHSPGDDISDLFNSTGRGSSIYFFEIAHCRCCNAVFVFAPGPIFAPKAKNCILFPSLRCPSMKKFGISVSLSITVNLAALVPKGLFTVQEIVDLLPEPINVCPKSAIMVVGGERVQGFLLLLDFPGNVTHYFLIPTGKNYSTSLKARSNTFECVCDTTTVPG